MSSFSAIEWPGATWNPVTGGTRKHENGRRLDGRTYDDMPLAAERPATASLRPAV